jgi:hypothetical protein
VSDAKDNGITFSFADKDDEDASVRFELIKKAVAEELLKSIADFKLVRSGEFRLAWYGKIDVATTESEIQNILAEFADIEGDSEAGWSLVAGNLVFTLSQTIDQIQVFKYVPDKTDITALYLTSLPDA